MNFTTINCVISQFFFNSKQLIAVSYTHLTLPTKLEV